MIQSHHCIIIDLIGSLERVLTFSGNELAEDRKKCVNQIMVVSKRNVKLYYAEKKINEKIFSEMRNLACKASEHEH